jgi:hypothetical protein
MFLENIVIDALEPQRVGAFWDAALGTERLTDEPDVVETRLAFEGGWYLDLCFQQVAEPATEPPRLHPDLLGGARQGEVVDRLLELGARRLDIGQGDVPWVVLADPEGNQLCVMEERAEYVGTGPIAALPLDSADPERDAEFWAWLSGWSDVPATAPRALRHPSGVGPLLELCREARPKAAAKNRWHLDVRLEQGEEPDAVEADIESRGGTRLHPGWGELPWRTYLDPSGNEFCVLPAPKEERA